jgi:hypothetical protein
LVEDSYEVDTRYSVEECLTDMMKVYVHAYLKPQTQDGTKNLDNNTAKTNLNNGHSNN